MEFDSLENIKQYFQHISDMNGKTLVRTKTHDYIHFPTSIWPNLIFNLKLKASDLDAWINQLQAKIKQNQHPKYLMCNSLDTPSELMLALKKHFPNNRSWASMTYDLKKPIHLKELPSFSIKQVYSKKDIDAWCLVTEISLMQKEGLNYEIFYNLLNQDSIEFYLVYENQTPVAVSMLYKAGEWAGIYCVGTLPSYQRKGYGKVATQFAMQRGLERGCSIAILQATLAGEPVYDRIGYENRGRIELFDLLVD